MNTDIKKVNTSHEIGIVSELAKTIWTQHFAPIIGDAQVDYMLKRFQSRESIRAQMLYGYEYYLVTQEDESIAYFGLVPNVEDNKMMISKIYAKLDARGKGHGKRILRFTEKRSLSMNIQTVWLTVNRYNKETIDWYLRRGFIVTNEIKIDIGGGFFMDDYIMEKVVPARVSFNAEAVT